MGTNLREELQIMFGYFYFKKSFNKICVIVLHVLKYCKTLNYA